MVLTTTYDLLFDAGLETNSGMIKKLYEAIGGRKAYGRHRPITVASILDISSLGDGLWSLRAVHPEQRYAASRVARTICIKAYNTATLRFAEPNRFLSKAVGVAESYLDGRAGLNEMRAERVDVFDRLIAVKGRPRHLWYAAWLALLDRPELYVRDMETNLRLAMPADTNESRARAYVTEGIATVTKALRQAIEPTDEGCVNIGPGLMVSAREAELQYIPTSRELDESQSYGLSLYNPFA